MRSHSCAIFFENLGKFFLTFERKTGKITICFIILAQFENFFNILCLYGILGQNKKKCAYIYWIIWELVPPSQNVKRFSLFRRWDFCIAILNGELKHNFVLHFFAFPGFVISPSLNWTTKDIHSDKLFPPPPYAHPPLDFSPNYKI